MPTDCLLTVSCLPASCTLLQPPAGPLCGSRVHALPALAGAILLCTESSSPRCFQLALLSVNVTSLERTSPPLLLSRFPLCAHRHLKHPPTCVWMAVAPSRTRCQSPTPRSPDTPRRSTVRWRNGERRTWIRAPARRGGRRPRT